MSGRLRGWRWQAITLALMLAIAVVALWGNWAQAGTHVGGTWTTDYYHFHWNYGWLRHALSSGLDPYFTDYVLFPSVNNLALHTLTPFWFPLWALLEPAIGTLRAFNVLYTLAMALAGAAMAWLMRREGATTPIAWAGGAAFLLAPGMLLSVMLANLNYLSLFWLPLALIAWRALADGVQQGRGRAAIGYTIAFGLILYGMMMTEYQLALFLALLIVPYGLLTLWRSPSWAARVRVMVAGAAAIGIALVLLWAAGPLRPLLAFPFSELAPPPIENARGIPFPVGYLSRYGTWDRVVTLGGVLLPAIGFAVVAAIVSRRTHGAWFWLLVIIPPLVLSAGAAVEVGGARIDLPYSWLHRAFGGLFRNPARLDAVIWMAGLLFIGKVVAPGWEGAARRWRWRWFAPIGGAILLALVVIESRILIDPMPLQPAAPPYQVYDQIGAEQGAPYDNMVIVTIPNAGGSGEAWVGAGDTGQPYFDEFKPMQAQFYGLTHGKRMLNGAIARAPIDHFWNWLYDDPMLAWFGQRRYLEPALVEAQLRGRVFGWPIGYVMVHQDWIGRESVTNGEVIGYLNSLDGLLCAPIIERDLVAYRTAWHPDGCPMRTPPLNAPDTYLIDLGAEGDERFIGAGWYWQETVGGVTWRWMGNQPQAIVYADLPTGAYRVTLHVQAFAALRSLTLDVNRVNIGEAVIQPEGLQTVTFDVPANAIGDGQHVTLTITGAAGEADARRLALAVDWVRFEVVR